MKIVIKHKNTGVVLFDGLTSDLHNADLQCADLQCADLHDANLQYANLQYADLQYADLQYADLQYADLRNADLRNADLRNADLYNANLQYADLRNADLRNADLQYANLYNANLPHFKICPEEGGFYAWKKTTTGIIKVYIPSKAQRCNSLKGRKCRASSVKVISGPGVGGLSPNQNNQIYYLRGEIIHSDTFNDDIRLECTNGIHFFMTKQEALEW